MSINFKVNKTADSGNISANDRSGIVNGSYSFLKNFDVKLNSKKVYDCKEANHAVKIKICSNIVQFMLKAHAATNEFFYLNTNKNAEERAACKNQLNYNKGF